MIALIILLVIIDTRARRSSSRRSSSYNRTNNRSSSGSSGGCSSSPTICVVAPMASIVGLFFIIFSCVCISNYWKRLQREKEHKEYKKRQEERERKALLKKKQEEEASRLEKLQLQAQSQAQVTIQPGMTNPYSVTTVYQNQQDSSNPTIIMPGSTIQPNYAYVNPYAGNHNIAPPPVAYNPGQYGVQYDMFPSSSPQPIMYDSTKRQNEANMFQTNGTAYVASNNDTAMQMV